MLSASPISSQTVGRTFLIAISVLGVGAVVQLSVVGWAFIAKFHAGPSSMAQIAEAEPAPLLARLSTPVPAVKNPDLSVDPFSEPPQTLTSTPAPAVPPRPTPIPLSAQRMPEAGPTNRFEELIAQGKLLRERGDTSTALTRFREASVINPRGPIAIAEIAATYEKMGLLDKAGEQWRRIYDMGTAAGIYFSLAEAKLKATQARAIQEVVTQIPEAAEVEGIASGMTLGLTGVKTGDETDDASAKKFTLRIPIKARPKTKIDAHELVVHVHFYDIVDGQNVVQTTANVNSRWISAPADWLEGDTEELAVEYQLPKPEARAAKREDRKFFGYIVRIYYKGQLQAASAEPERLAQQYPAPPTLPKESEK